MEKRKQLKSIWGKGWQSIRKWFYSTWLIYETSIRFYDYGQSVHGYFINQQDYLGEVGAQVLAIFFGLATFTICTFFLTLPTCLLLYKFFQTKNLTGTLFEESIKTYF